MRFGVLAAALVLSSPAHAGWLETGGFAGVDALPSTIRLGGDPVDAEQRPHTGPEFGLRLGLFGAAGPWLQLGVEGELGFTAAWTGYGFDSGRASSFAPVIGYRANLVLRYTGYAPVEPHVLVGVGADSVVSSSSYLTDSSDLTVSYGIGATVGVSQAFQLRVDARQGWIPTLHGEGATYEVLVGISTTIGKPHPRAAPPPPVEAAPVAAPPPAPTPPQPPVVAPQPPPATALDPGADADADGIPNGKDACPHDPETVNGYQDDDGCPDTVPADVAAALARAKAIRFEPTHARLTDDANAACQPALDLLRANPKLSLYVVSHASGDAGLAKRRADAVKWHFVEQGVPEDRLTVITGAPATDADPAPIELILRAR